MANNIPSQSKLQVSILAKDRSLYSGEVAAVTSYNDDGIFDILSGHANFITLVKNQIILHKKDNTDQKFPIEKGVMKVRGDMVEIYVVV